MLNPFSNDAFDMVALTAAINEVPNTYGQARTDGPDAGRGGAGAHHHY